MKYIVLFLAVIVSVPAWAEPDIRTRPDKVVNGGMFWLEIAGVEDAQNVRVKFQGVSIPLWKVGDALTAIVPVHQKNEPGQYPLRVTVGKELISHNVEVVDANYKVEKLTLPKDKVSGFSAETLARIASDKKALDALWVTHSKERLWEGGWDWPVNGAISSSFGKRRIINGQPKSPHSGTDHRAAKGTPIGAAHRGRVVLTDDQFYAGNLVILDHGQGLYTMYFHMSEIDVKLDDVVEQGDPIGKVGATGRASGAHLHWGVRLLNHRVDAERLLELLPPESKNE